MPKNKTNPPVSANHVNDINAALEDVHLTASQIPKKAYSYGAMEGADGALAALEKAVQSARYRIAGALVAAHGAHKQEGGKAVEALKQRGLVRASTDELGNDVVEATEAGRAACTGSPKP